MYKIIICDDEVCACLELKNMLSDIQRKLNTDFEIKLFHSGEKLCEYLEQRNHADIIFLDIELVKLTGIDAGCFIRDELKDAITLIVYISSKQDYVFQLFHTQPIDFLIKPIDEIKMEGLMRNLMVTLNNRNQIFEFQNGNELYRIPYDEILYFVSEGHKVKVVQQQGEYKFYGKLKNIRPTLPPQFISIHTSYLVNRNHVKRYTYDLIEMSNKDNLTISRTYQKKVRQILLNEWKEDEA